MKDDLHQVYARLSTGVMARGSIGTELFPEPSIVVRPVCEVRIRRTSMQLLPVSRLRIG